MKTKIALIVLIFSQIVIASSKEERKVLFNEATQNLKKTGIEERVLKSGESFPNLSLDGKQVSSFLKNGPLVVTFYRGGWCPYCVTQLKLLNESLKLLVKNNVTLVAISPEKIQEVNKTKSKNKLDFILLSDKGNQLARSLGIVFKVDSKVVSVYKSLGIDLEDSQGNNEFELPMPATFVIGTDQKVLYSFADADYTKRADLDKIIEALKIK